MTVYNITVSNILKVKYQTAGDTLSLWGTMVWGTGFWWGDFETPSDIDKGIDLALTLSQAMDKRIDKWLSDPIALTQTLGVNFNKGIDNTFTFSTSIAVAVTQGNWTRDEPNLATWTLVDDGSVVWTETTSASTNWS